MTQLSTHISELAPATRPQPTRRSHHFAPFNRDAVAGALFATALTAIFTATLWLALESMSSADCNRYRSCALALVMQSGTPE